MSDRDHDPDAGLDIDRLAALFDEGCARAEAGDRAGAAAAFRAALALDPEDRGGVALRLAAIGAAPPPPKASPLYIRMLFDEHAEAFESCLVEDLGYRVPTAMRALLAARAPGPHRTAIDLGCGTGLVGAEIAPMCERLVGVDLSPGMLRRAAVRGVYRQLVLSDAVDALVAWRAARRGPVDLVLAADMLIYLGDLAPLFAAAARVIRAGGHLVVSTETRLEGHPPGWDYAVEDGRYAHSERYLRERLVAAGFVLAALEVVAVRAQAGTPVPGHLALARRV